MQISEITRRNIFDILVLSEKPYHGRLEETEFLGRVFNLANLPSTDNRFTTALGDIRQHRLNNNDWPDNWVFFDTRFDLLRGDDQAFLQFLCEILHPVVQPDADVVEQLKKEFNEHLRRDGYEIAERTRISDKPIYAARTVAILGPGALSGLKEKFSGADVDYVSQQITRMESAIYDDPGLAIGTAKELVETCCKTILKEIGENGGTNEELAQLVRRTTRELQLVPADIPNEAKAAKTIKRVLSNLATLTQGISELRNHYGTGHGRDASARGLGPRHAKLAVGAASTLAVFLLETHEQRQTRTV